eukprot:SAG31_NODE_3429_length_4284_cov_7.544086_10_plen_154_part_00
MTSSVEAPAASVGAGCARVDALGDSRGSRLGHRFVGRELRRCQLVLAEQQRHRCQHQLAQHMDRPAGCCTRTSARTPAAARAARPVTRTSAVGGRAAGDAVDLAESYGTKFSILKINFSNLPTPGTECYTKYPESKYYIKSLIQYRAGGTPNY